MAYPRPKSGGASEVQGLSRVGNHKRVRDIDNSGLSRGGGGANRLERIAAVLHFAAWFQPASNGVANLCSCVQFLCRYGQRLHAKSRQNRNKLCRRLVSRQDIYSTSLSGGISAVKPRLSLHKSQQLLPPYLLLIESTNPNTTTSKKCHLFLTKLAANAVSQLLFVHLAPRAHTTLFTLIFLLSSVADAESVRSAVVESQPMVLPAAMPASKPGSGRLCVCS